MKNKFVVGITAVGSGIGHAVLDATKKCSSVSKIIGFEVDPRTKGFYECHQGFIIPFFDDKNYIDVLLQRCLESEVKLLLPGSDCELLPLSENLPRFQDHGIRIVVSDPRCIRLCRDKLELARYLRMKKLPFVLTMEINDANQASDALVYPVVLKLRKGSGSVGTRIIESKFELAHYSKILEKGEWIVQPFLMPLSWLEKPDVMEKTLSKMHETQRPFQKEEISVQFFLDSNGNTLGSFASLNALKDGVPMIVASIKDNIIIKEAEAIVRNLVPIGLRGPINLQGRITTEGPIFFEINTRFTGVTHARTMMGYKEVEAAVLSFGQGAPSKRVAEALGPVKDAIGLRQMSEAIIDRSLVNGVEKNKSWRGRHGASGSVLVTGSTGYLGISVIDMLMNRDKSMNVIVAARDPQRAHFIYDDKAYADRINIVKWSQDEPLPFLEEISSILHMASERPCAKSNADRIFSSNLKGIISIIDIVRRLKIKKLLFISSQTVYGTETSRPWHEEIQIQPESSYGYSKAAAEAVIQTLKDSVTSWIILRFARLYGKNQAMRIDELPHMFAYRAAKGLPLIIHGDGSQEVDLLNIKDAIEAVNSAWTADDDSWNTVYNIGSGKPISIKNLASLCISQSRNLTGHRSEMEYHALKNPSQSFGMDISKIEAHIGWKPKVDTRQGIEDLIRGYLCDDPDLKTGRAAYKKLADEK